MKQTIVLPKMIFLDVNPSITASWCKYFNMDSVEIASSDFKEFIKFYGNEIDAIVSPANSFGLMDGGYDKAIIEVYGNELQTLIKEKIQKKYYGEQPVGTAMTVKIPGTSKILIHVPTMRTPCRIKDEMVIYHCMRSTLIEAVNQGVKRMLVPAFGGLTGQVPPDTIARMMWGACVQFSISYPVSSWEEAIDYTDIHLWAKYFAK